MGPQHPSTHGVLRLILELDGETVTEARAGIGYLHTGIEKNMEFRTWVQGVTFCTRMDYLTPMFNEAAYCLAVEKLLGITDQIPERASIIRVLMMELTRINSHLVCLGTGGMELGATTVMTVGFRERERILRVFEAVTGLRMNNAYIRPGGVSQDVPHGAVDMVREVVTELRRGIHELELLLNENPLLKGRTVGVGFMDLTGCMALGMTGPVLRATGLPHDLRKSAPYCGYETYEFDVVTRTGCDAYDRLRIRIDEMYESLKIVEQALDRLQRTEGQPVMVEDKKIAWPAQLAIGGDGQGNSLDHIREIMGSSMESLIHHFKLVTEGFRVPPGQAYARGRVGQGRARLPRRLRRRHPPLPGPLPRPELQQPAGRGLDVRGRPGRRRHRGRGLHRPRHGRCRPLMSHDFGLQTASGHLTVSEESKEPYPADVEATLPRRRRRGHRALPAEALGAAAAAAPRAVRRRLRHRPRHRPVRRAARPHHRRGLRRRHVLHAVQAPPQRHLHRRRLHQHAVRGHGRRRDLGCRVRAPRHRPRRDHRRRPGHPRAHRVQRRLRLRPGGDDQLGVLRQPDPGLHHRARRRAARRRAGRPHPRPEAGRHLQGGQPRARRLPRRARRRGRRRRPGHPWWA